MTVARRDLIEQVVHDALVGWDGEPDSDGSYYYAYANHVIDTLEAQGFEIEPKWNQ